MTGVRLDEFAERAAHKSSAEYYFHRDVTLEIIERCEKENTLIYGIDGALIEASGIREPIDAILVLVDDPHSYAAARRHVSRAEHLGLVWCLTLGDDLEETA